MSFGMKLQESFLKSMNDGNTAMARQIRLMAKQNTLATKQARTVAKLGKAQDSLNRHNLRAYAIITRQGKVVAGLSNRFNLLSSSMMGLALQSGKGFLKFLHDVKTSFRSIYTARKAPGYVPKGAAGFELPSTPSMREVRKRFDLRHSTTNVPVAGAFPKAAPQEREALAVQRGLGGFTSSEELAGQFRSIAMAPRGPPSSKGTFMRQPGKAEKAFKSFNNNVTKPLLQLGMGAMSTFGPIMVLGLFLKGISAIGTTFQPVTDLITIFLELVGTGFQPLVTQLLTSMTNPQTMNLLMSFTQELNTVSTSLAPLMPMLVDFVIIGLTPLHAAVQGLAFVSQFTSPFILSLSKSINTATKPLMMLITLFYGGSPGLIPGLNLVNDALNPVVKLFYSVNDAFKDTRKQGERLWEMLVEFYEWMSSIASKGADAVKSTAKKVKNTGSSVVGGIKDFFGLRGGGIVNPPGDVFRVGEGRKPEVVSDIDQLVGIIQEALGSRGSGQSITININGVAPGSDLRELALQIGKELRWI